MGKAGRWLRSFLTRKKDRKGKDRGDSQPSLSSSTVPTPPSAKEKRRWSFRRPPVVATSKETSASSHGHGQLASTSSHCFSDVHAVVHDQLAAVAIAVAVAAASPAPERTAYDVVEEDAAIKIQSAFRSYLARKALCALRGMVKLQAMVRGHLVRRQASMTLRRMQALVAAQKRARAERLRLLDEDNKHTHSPRPPTSRRSSPQHHRSGRKPLEVVDRGSEENVKVVEVDNGGGGDARGGTAKGYGRRSTCCSTPPVSRTQAKAELHHKVSPTPSALTDASARTMSGLFEDYSFSAAASEASGARHHRGATGGDHALALQQLFPNYMSNTESSRAKARSQSAPRQRHDQASASPSPLPSCGEWTLSSNGRRRRASLDPRDLAAAAAGGARMERCASQARASASAACPWAVRLDRSTASLAGSECDSSSTAATAARMIS